LPLVREIKSAVLRKVQIVQPFEALAIEGADERLDARRFRVEHQQPFTAIADIEPPVLVYLHAVRPAVVLDDELPLPFRINAEYAAERDVHHPQVAVAVEARPFEKTLDFDAAAVRFGPCVAARFAEATGQCGKDLRPDELGLLEWVMHGASVTGASFAVSGADCNR